MVSGIIYVLLKFILPSIDFRSIGVNAFFKGLSQVALVVALVFLLPAPISAFKSWQKRRPLDTQKDLDSIRALNWLEFEELVGEAYRRQGYKVIENMSPGLDEGIDLAWIPMLVIRLNTTRTNRSEVVGVFLLTKGSGYLCYGYRQPRAGGCGRVSESER